MLEMGTIRNWSLWGINSNRLDLRRPKGPERASAEEAVPVRRSELREGLGLKRPLERERYAHANLI